MTYIGNPPLGSFASTTSQSFNGTGSATVFTLNKNVNSATDLECFVCNVQQEPGTGKAFTASGTTLTFSEAPPSGTGNIYVIYRGLAQNVGQDENAPRLVGDNTLTGDQTFNGNVVINEDSADVDFRVESDASANALFVEGSSSNIGIGTASPNVIDGATNTHVDIRSDNSNYSFLQLGVTGTKTSSDVGYLEFLNGNNARLASISGGADGANNDGYLSLATLTGGSYTQKLKIDHDGHVTKPLQPAFAARLNRASGGANGYDGTLVFDTENFDIGSNYNTTDGKFTTPVAGIYQFSFVGFGCDSTGSPVPTSTSVYVQMQRDGTTFGVTSYSYSNGSTTYPNMSFTQVQQLNAGEDITIKVFNQYVYADTAHTFDPYFCGHLIG